MAKEVTLKVPQYIYKMLETLAKNKKPVDYLSDIIIKNFEKK